MHTVVHDHISVTNKLNELGIAVPAGFALLPSNLADAKSVKDLRQHAESETVRKLLRANKVTLVEIFDDDNQPLYLQQYGFEWFGPTLFVSAGLLSQDPNILSVTLGVITNYLYDHFKGSKNGTASLDVIYQKPDGTCKQVQYKGPVDGLSNVAEIVRALGEEH